MAFLSAPSNFLVQRFHHLDSKDLGLWDLGMNNDRKGLLYDNGSGSDRDRDHDHSHDKDTDSDIDACTHMGNTHIS